MQNKRTLIWAIWISVLIELAESICSGSQYWNPLNNACVNRKYNVIQNAHGVIQHCTTQTLRLICA